jgi:histidinol-phosphate aminotransferase
VTATWNLLVMRTLSKLGLAGLRLGYLAGPRAWIEQFDKLRLPYNINVLTQVSAEFALERQDVLDAQVSRIVADRKIVFDGLAALAGVYPYESRANFVLFRLVGHDAAKVFDSLRDAGVLIKNLHPSGGALSQCLRVTVGTPTENSTFLQRLEQILARN